MAVTGLALGLLGLGVGIDGVAGLLDAAELCDGVCAGVGEATTLVGEVAEGDVPAGEDAAPPIGVEDVAEGGSVVFRVPMGKPGQKPQ